MELVASFTLNNDNLDAEFDVSEGQNFDTLFQIDTQLSIVGEGVIDVTTANGRATVTSVTYIHEQGIAADTWIIKHNLNKYPSCFAVDSSGTIQIPDEIVYNSEDQMTIYFISAFAGKAYLN